LPFFKKSLKNDIVSLMDTLKTEVFRLTPLCFCIRNGVFLYAKATIPPTSTNDGRAKLPPGLDFTASQVAFFLSPPCPVYRPIG
jgi:hypothetical protein